MGRPALSDAEKKARQTFDPRYSEQARGQAASAKVIAFPSLQDIPSCSFPLDDEGQRIYDDLTRTLFEQGRLTVLTHLEISALAGGISAERAKISAGKSASAIAFVRFLERVDKLQRASVDRAYAGSSTEGRSNKFARSGFAARR